MTDARLVITLDDGRPLEVVLEKFELEVVTTPNRIPAGELSDGFRFQSSRSLTLTSDAFRFAPVTVTPEELAAAFGLTVDQVDEVLSRDDPDVWHATGDILRRGDRIETLTLEPWTIADRMATAGELCWAEFREELEHGLGWSAGEGAAGAFDHEEAMAVVDELVRVFRYERPLR